MRRFLIAIGLTFAAANASAQSYLSPEPPPNSVEDRFRLELDLFQGSYDTRMRLDLVVPVAGMNPIVIPGTELSAEDDLGLPSSQLLGQIELTLLPGKHHLIRFNALSMRREGSAVLTKPVLWGNSVYVVGDRIDSHFNLTMVGLTYGYLPFRTDRFELGATFGIQIASVDANAVSTRNTRSDESADGPVPLIGIEARYDFSRRWSVDGRFQYLSLGLIEKAGVDLSGVEGQITDFRVALRWRQNQHFVYGLGYRSYNVDVNATESDPSGMVTMSLSGPLLFIQASL
jgi:hypothetical protein